MVTVCGLGVAVFAFAAWQDAPAAPPGYGAVPPTDQASFQPVNLSTARQDKAGTFSATELCLGVTGNTNCITSWTGGSVGTNYWSYTSPWVYPVNGTDKVHIGSTSPPSSTAMLNIDGQAGLTAFTIRQTGGSAIHQFYIGNSGEGAIDLYNGSAQSRVRLESVGNSYFRGTDGTNGPGLTINNPYNVVKNGSGGDALYAYADSTNSAVSAEQANAAGWAVYASGRVAGDVFYDRNDTNYFINPNGTPTSGTLAGNLNADTFTASNQFCIGASCISSWPSPGGSGTVTQLNPGVGITLAPNPITVTGTIAADTTYLQRIVSDASCSGPNLSIKTISSTGSVTCEADDGMPGGASGDTLRHNGTSWVGNNIIYNDGTNVGIGTTALNALSKLEVAGNTLSSVYYDRDNTSYFINPNGTPTSGTLAGNLNVDSLTATANVTVAGSPVCRLDGVNCPGSASESDTLQTVTDRGNTTTQGITAASFNVSSDIRLKKNVATLTSTLENLRRVRGVSYEWRVNEFPERKFSPEPQIGVIAQELEQVYPELVFTDANGYKAVAYDKLSAVLLEAVKELKAEVDDLKKQVEQK